MLFFNNRIPNYKKIKFGYNKNSLDKEDKCELLLQGCVIWILMEFIYWREMLFHTKYGVIAQALDNEPMVNHRLLHFTHNVIVDT